MFWPHGFGTDFEWCAAAIGVAAFVALWRFRLHVMAVIAAAAAAGLLRLFVL
ncbi:MAG: hypothetical protein ACJ8NR_13075 [Sulfurifustis sp.]